MNPPRTYVEAALREKFYPVDGTRFHLVDRGIANPCWYVLLEGMVVDGPFRSKGAALSAALAKAREEELRA